MVCFDGFHSLVGLRVCESSVERVTKRNIKYLCYWFGGRGLCVCVCVCVCVYVRAVVVCVYVCVCVFMCVSVINTFYLRLYDVSHMVKNHSDCYRGNPLPPHGLFFPISSKCYFICTIPQTLLQYRLEREIAQWVQTISVDLISDTIQPMYTIISKDLTLFHHDTPNSVSLILKDMKYVRRSINQISHI